MIEYKVISAYDTLELNGFLREHTEGDEWLLVGPVTAVAVLSDVGYPKTRYVATLYRGQVGESWFGSESQKRKYGTPGLLEEK